MAPQDLFGNDVPEDEDSRLKDEDEETQLVVMRTWFHENYQDPVEETPYDGREGGYQHLHGGPYDPKEELEGRGAGWYTCLLSQEMNS
jgi:hypothetical protein